MHEGEDDLGTSSGSSSGKLGGVASRHDDGGEDIGAGDESNKKEDDEVGPRRVLPYVLRTVGLLVSLSTLKEGWANLDSDIDTAQTRYVIKIYKMDEIE